MRKADRMTTDERENIERETSGMNRKVLFSLTGRVPVRRLVSVSVTNRKGHTR